MERIKINNKLTGRESIGFRITDSVEEWQRLQPEWNSLVAGSLEPSFFLTHEYLTSAWVAYGQNAVLHIIQFYADETLLGIVPLKLSSRRVCGIPSTTLRPIGGEESEGNFFIVLNGEFQFYVAFLDYLDQHSNIWDKVYFNLIHCCHPFTSLFLQKFSGFRHLIVERHEQLIHPFITTTDNWEEYLKSLNRKFLSSIRAKVRKACDMGELQVVRFDSPADIGRNLAVYVDLENRSWKTAEDSGITRTANLFRLYREIFSRCAESNMVDLTYLVLDGRILASGIGVIYYGRFTYLQTVYDVSASHLSPGMLLMTINVWRAFRAGIKIVDFMGNYVEYKRNWTNTEWHSCTVCIRKLLSGEGLAYLGSRWVRPAIESLPWRRAGTVSVAKETQRLPLLSFDTEALDSRKIILRKSDIMDIFLLKDAKERQSQIPDTVPNGMPDDEVIRMVDERNMARRNQEWQQADMIRETLLRVGVVLKDLPEGTEWFRSIETPTSNVPNSKI